MMGRTPTFAIGWLAPQISVDARWWEKSCVLLALVALLTSVMAVTPGAAPDASSGDRASGAGKPDAGSWIRPLGREYFVGGYIGAPYHHRSDVSIKQPGGTDLTFKNVGWYTKPFKSPIYYGARVARWSERQRFGLMVDFTHSKALALLDEKLAVQGKLDGKALPEHTTIREHFRRLEFSHGHNMLTVNALYRLPSPSQRVSPYLGLGAGVSLPHAEFRRQGTKTRTYEYQYTGPAFKALIGLELRVARMSYFLEYQFTFAPYAMPLTDRDGRWLAVDLWRQLSRWWRGEAPKSGWLKTQLSSHQIVGGMGVRLAPARPVQP